MILFCNRHGMGKFSIRKSGKRVCCKCETYRARTYRVRLKRKAVEYKGGSCLNCGYNKSLRALDFHHRDPSQKDFAIGEARQGKKIVRAWQAVMVELDKCDLLCKNCHAEVHEAEDRHEYHTDHLIHKKNIGIINSALLRGTKTLEEIMEEINSGKYTKEWYETIQIEINKRKEKLYFKKVLSRIPQEVDIYKSIHHDTKI